MKVLFCGDAHLRATWHHGSDFEDGRRDERRTIEDSIVAAAAPCGIVVLAGDVLDARDNPSSVIRHLVSFLERFGEKQLYLMVGNHDSDASGRSALDFIRELSNKNWHVVHGEVSTVVIDNKPVVMVPYFRRQQFGVETDTEVVEKIMDLIRNSSGMTKQAVTVLHHAIGGTVTASGQMTDKFQEPVMVAEDLLQASSRVLGAHIHKPQDSGRLQIIGSWMCQDVGETEDKRVLRWDSVTDEMESIVLPGRKLMKLVNPTREQLASIKGYNGMIKIISDEPVTVPDGMAEKVVVLEMPKSDRKKAATTSDFSVPNLLRIYAEARSVPLEGLLEGWRIINE